MSSIVILIRTEWSELSELYLTLSQTSPGFCVSFENTLEKEKLFVTSNFSFSYCVFYPFGDLSSIFIKLEIYRQQILSIWKHKKIVDSERVKNLLYDPSKNMAFMGDPFFLAHLSPTCSG